VVARPALSKWWLSLAGALILQQFADAGPARPLGHGAGLELYLRPPEPLIRRYDRDVVYITGLGLVAAKHAATGLISLENMSDLTVGSVYPLEVSEAIVEKTHTAGVARVVYFTHRKTRTGQGRGIAARVRCPAALPG
jgi:hypothetical protein